MAHNDFLSLYTRTQKYATSSDTTEAKGFVNDAYKEIVGQLALLPTSKAITWTVGTMSYTLTGAPISVSDLLSIQHLYYTSSGQSYRMTEISFDYMLELRSYSAVVAPPGLYYLLNGQNNLEIYPAPVTGDTGTLYYIQTPTALSADGDTIASSIMPSEYQNVIPLRAGMMLADYEDPESGIADLLEQKYMRYLAMMKKWDRDRTGQQQRIIRPGYADRRRKFYHDPSTYYSGDR